MQHTENRQDKNTFIFHTQGWFSQIHIVALQQSKPETLLIAAVLSCQSILHPFRFSAGGSVQPVNCAENFALSKVHNRSLVHVCDWILWLVLFTCTLLAQRFSLIKWKGGKKVVAHFKGLEWWTFTPIPLRSCSLKPSPPGRPCSRRSRCALQLHQLGEQRGESLNEQVIRQI